MAHYVRADGVLVGHGATVRELDALSTLFDEVRHVGCLHEEPPPDSALPYRAKNLELVPVPPAGGETFGSKLDVVTLLPRYVQVISRQLRDADVVHVRCPANVSLCALAVLAVTRHPKRRWVKYAGNWWPYPREPRSYALQRRWLASPRLGAVVTINGDRGGLPAHVHAFTNPCLTDSEIETGAKVAAGKVLTNRIRLLFVGNLAAAKNPLVAVDVVDLLNKQGVLAHLDLVGAGPETEMLRSHVEARALSELVTFHGALPRDMIDELYAVAHFVVLPSKTEGWPKVLSEGMAAGALPIATAVGSIPEILGRIGAGKAIAGDVRPESFADAILDYCRAPGRWRREVELGLSAASQFSYSAYLDAVSALLQLS